MNYQRRKHELHLKVVFIGMIYGMSGDVEEAIVAKMKPDCDI